jgi:hypothetical protein
MSIGEIAVGLMLCGVGLIALFMGITMVFPCLVCPSEGTKEGERNVRTDTD